MRVETVLCLSNSGKTTEALKTIEDSMNFWQELLAIDSHANLDCMNDLPNRLMETGQNAKAIETSRQMITLQRERYTVSPQAIKPGLARSLHNLAIYLISLEEHTEASEVLVEAVRLRTELYQDHPQAHAADLANSLYGYHHT